MSSDPKEVSTIDFSGGNGPELRSLKTFLKAPTDISLSYTGEYLSIGFEDGTINICQTEHLAVGNYYKFIEYRAH